MPALKGWKWGILLFIGLGAMLAFVACGGGGEKKAPAAATPGASPAATKPPAAATKPPAAAVGPLKIGVLTSQTGSLGDFGQEAVRAIKLAQKHINAAGGVFGKPVELVLADDGSAPEQALAEARRLVDVERVHAIIGMIGSGVTLPTAESVCVPSKVPCIASAASSPALALLKDNGFLYSTIANDTFPSVVLAQVTAEKLGFKKVCTMYVNNPYGKGLNDGFVKSFTDTYKGTVTAQVAHADVSAATTYLSELNQCRQGSPEALISLSYGVGQADVYIREAIENGFFTKKQIILSAGEEQKSFIESLGWNNLDGSYGTTQGAFPTDLSKSYESLYAAEYGGPPKAAFSNEAYDAFMVAALAAAAANSTDGPAIRDQISKITNAPGEKIGPGPDEAKKALGLLAKGQDIDFQGATGLLEFDKDGAILVSGVRIWHVDAAKKEFVNDGIVKLDLVTGEIGAPVPVPVP